mmetsp:Transcript_15192/g.45814  ORF Transcript_15192/g.45814 Transcript_15192/m.45814 type:complete len:98 (+) Transcript_15192:231-524(+)
MDPSRNRTSDQLRPPDEGPKPHRCNARVEDVIQSLFAEGGFSKAKAAAGVAWRCIQSEPGQEPQDAYQTLTDPEKYLRPMVRKRVPLDFPEQPKTER